MRAVDSLKGGFVAADEQGAPAARQPDEAVAATDTVRVPVRHFAVPVGDRDSGLDLIDGLQAAPQVPRTLETQPVAAVAGVQVPAPECTPRRAGVFDGPEDAPAGPGIQGFEGNGVEEEVANDGVEVSRRRQRPPGNRSR
jgi:hypothetical protein